MSRAFDLGGNLASIIEDPAELGPSDQELAEFGISRDEYEEDCRARQGLDSEGIGHAANAPHNSPATAGYLCNDEPEFYHLGARTTTEGGPAISRRSKQRASHTDPGAQPGNTASKFYAVSRLCRTQAPYTSMLLGYLAL